MIGRQAGRDDYSTAKGRENRMLTNWFRKREIERLRASCPHDWRKVREYEGEYYNGHELDFYDAVTIYCPICDVKKDVTPSRAEEILGIQEMRKQYENGGESND